ncbi:TetR-like C-terminal domain-containing protein [Amycolatopsis sp. NPDC051061]|uniref:TetR-like C-terminal domain-containing protein n=1 Tax=Amycolatopsis sp. NPDC051061 TaxID=3155042 RepID=UPI003428CA2C
MAATRSTTGAAVSGAGPASSPHGLGDPHRAEEVDVEVRPDLAPDADLDLLLEVLYAPLYQRWLLRTGPLTESYADALVATTLKAFRP